MAERVRLERVMSGGLYDVATLLRNAVRSFLEEGPGRATFEAR